MQADLGTATIGILAKFWQPGRVKTRLGASIGMDRAAELHRVFVTHLLHQLLNVRSRRVLCVDPPDCSQVIHDALVQQKLERHWQITAQTAGPLGTRMQNWFREELSRENTSCAVLIGGDCPTIGPEEIRNAVETLEENDAVVIPADDGGYVLLGMRGPWRAGHGGHEALFDQIAWSTNQVLQQTYERARQADLRIAELPAMADVDTEADLQELRSRLRQLDASVLRDNIDAVMTESLTPERDP